MDITQNVGFKIFSRYSAITQKHLRMTSKKPRTQSLGSQRMDKYLLCSTLSWSICMIENNFERSNFSYKSKIKSVLLRG